MSPRETGGPSPQEMGIKPENSESQLAAIIEKYGDVVTNLTPEEQNELAGIDGELGGKVFTTSDDNKKDARRRALVTEATYREYRKPPQP